VNIQHGCGCLSASMSQQLMWRIHNYLDDLRTPAETHSTSGLWYNGMTTLSTFWCHEMEGYPHIAKAALEIITPVVNHISVSKDSQNWRRLRPRKGARLNVNMTRKLLFPKRSQAFLKLFRKSNNKGNIKLDVLQLVNYISSSCIQIFISFC